MARPSGPKTRCNGRWTEAKFNSFIKNNIRRMSWKWQPIVDCKKQANTRRGFYMCNGCKQEVPASIKNEKGKRVDNAIVDHINPIIDPETGFTTWDDCINRMFCEGDNLQVLCHDCHKTKSLEEANIAKLRRQKEKQ